MRFCAMSAAAAWVGLGLGLGLGLDGSREGALGERAFFILREALYFLSACSEQQVVSGEKRVVGRTAVSSEP